MAHLPCRAAPQLRGEPYLNSHHFAYIPYRCDLLLKELKVKLKLGQAKVLYSMTTLDTLVALDMYTKAI